MTKESPGYGSAKKHSSSLTWAEWRQVFAIGFTQFTQGMQLTLPFTIAVYMVRDWEGHISEERVSRLTGLLAAVYSSSAFLTALAWGYLSDHIGRKPVIIIGNVVCTAAIVGFGAAPSYGIAVFMRFCGGFFNGITGSLKTMIGESFDGDGQARALSALSCAWGIGTVVGSLMGGSLADPCKELGNSFPLCQPGEMFERQPFFLPCATVGALSSFAAVISLFVLKETLPKGGARYSRLTGDEESGDQRPDTSHQRVSIHVQEPADTELVPICWADKRSGPQQHSRDDDGDSNDSGDSSEASRITAAPDSRSADASIGQHMILQDSLLTYSVDVAGHPSDGHSTGSACSPTSPHSPASSADTGHAAEGEQDQPHQQRQSQAGRPAGRRPAMGPDAVAFDSVPLTSAACTGESADGRPLQPGDAQQQQRQQRQQQQQQQQQQRPWYKSWEVQLTVLGYGAIALLNTFLNELVPLFASAPRDRGGLALKPSQLAGPLAFSGAAFLLYAAFGYPMFQRRFGILATALWGLALLVPCTMAIPLSCLPPADAYTASQAIFYLSLAAKGLAGMNAFTSSIVLVNKSAPAGQLGAVNGAGQMLASAVRGAAPAMCGMLWAASLGLRLPGHQFLPFAVVSVGFVGIFFWYYRQRAVITRLAR